MSIDQPFLQHLQQAKPLSLRIWLLSTLIILVTGTLFYNNHLPLPITLTSETFIAFNKKRLLDAADAKKPVIVILGDSRLRYGTLPPQQLQQLLLTQHKLDVHIVRITNIWATFSDFAELSNTILQIQPDLLIIQNTLLTRNKTVLAKKALLLEYLNDKIQKPNKPWDPGNFNQQTLQDSAHCSKFMKNETVKQRYQRTKNWWFYHPNGKHHPKLAAFLSQASQQNINIMFISTPISSEAKKILPTAPNYSLTLTPPNTLFTDNSFCDSVHLNTQGQTTYSHWLAQQIALHSLTLR